MPELVSSAAMHQMARGAAALVGLALSTTLAAGTDETWSGRIADSLCGAQHETPEGQEKMSDHDCTVVCVRGGSKYVFVSDGKVYPIANQSFAELATHAGEAVRIAGELKEGAITVSKVTPP